MENIGNFLKSETQDFNEGLELLKEHTKDVQYFENNKDAKKGSMPHNMLLTKLNRIKYEFEVKASELNSKKNSIPVLKVENQNQNPEPPKKDKKKK